MPQRNNMTREIKFRAWDRDNGKMLYNSTGEIPYSADENYIKIIGTEVLYYATPDMGYYGGGDWSAKHGNFVFMQYTGLKDKNGKEIYEGDLIDHDGLVLPVEWHNGAWTVEYFRIPTRMYLSTFDETDIEIIGNIYENPELFTSIAKEYKKIKDKTE